MNEKNILQYIKNVNILCSIFLTIFFCRTTKYLLGWEGLRRVYFFIMTENMRAIIRRWQKQLFPDEVKQRYDINERAIWSAATLCELDDAYTRRIAVRFRF